MDLYCPDLYGGYILDLYGGYILDPTRLAVRWMCRGSRRGEPDPSRIRAGSEPDPSRIRVGSAARARASVRVVRILSESRLACPHISVSFLSSSISEGERERGRERERERDVRMSAHLCIFSLVFESFVSFLSSFISFLVPRGAARGEAGRISVFEMDAGRLSDLTESPDTERSESLPK